MPNETHTGGEFPRAVIQKSHWYSRLVWVVPVVALVAAVFYAHDYFERRGPVIIVRFSDADGIRVQDTPVLHRGVKIGQVSEIALSEDKREVLVHVQLRRDEEEFASKGALFWIVRPEISNLSLSGLNTVFSGPYIASAPGRGGVELQEFTGLPKAPEPVEEGLKLTLYAPQMQHLEDHSSVYYKGIQVGVVKDVRLHDDGSRVEAQIVIWKRYAALVRTHTHFWALSGFDVQGGLFGGLQLKLESLRTLVAGAVAFATPEKDMGDPAKEGSNFRLEVESEKEWLEWAPHIPITPTSSGEESEPSVSFHRRAAGIAGK